MKWDWSKSLILIMGLFILLIVGMAIKMATSNQSLYQTDYYEQGEKHTDRMEREEVGKQVQVLYNPSSGTLNVSFDSIGVVQSVELRYLSDAGRDKRIKVSEGRSTHKAELSFGKLASGLWIMEIEGKVNGESFFKREQFVQ
jgi:hypothetical protein